MAITIVIPILDEAPIVPRMLRHLATLRERGVEIVIVDGGSADASADLVRAAGLPLLAAPRGRARQMNTGAAAANGDGLLFLHADTQLPPLGDELANAALADGERVWGRFDVRIEGRSLALRVIAWLMNLRSRLTGIATGDQAIFVTRVAFERVGGFPNQALMEDVELSRRLLRLSRPACLHAKAITSGRRWEQRGIWRTVMLMWRLRFDYWRGMPVNELARRYK
jgi:rSAM/selenodomain-associated transferase 2